MANSRHLKILGQGVEAWNSWREDNPKIVPNLQGANLRGRYLQNANFEKTKIKGTNFTNADLTNANFTEAKAGQPFFWNIILQVICSALCFTYFFVWTTISFMLSIPFTAKSDSSSINISNIIIIPFGITMAILIAIGWYILKKGLSSRLINLAIYSAIFITIIWIFLAFIPEPVSQKVWEFGFLYCQ